MPRWARGRGRDRCWCREPREILSLPVRLYRQAAEHSDGLFRELEFVRRNEADEQCVPARLLRLIDGLAVFRSFTSQPSEALADAVTRGDERIDLVYQVPVRVGEAALELNRLLDEADAYCRAGEHLLTLTTPPGPLAFRRWFLGEFVAQVEGAAPTSWEEFRARSGEAVAG